MAGLGRAAKRIAEELGGEVCPEYINATPRRWGVRRNRRHTFCQVPLTHQQRNAVEYPVEKAGLRPEDYLRKVIADAVVPA
ncbi:hypothetical protein SAMN02983003_0136 [Devosia enhydra]|uniref:Uncharacterized protein n=1 Tax=Devosia enhydra TaxID=665118 RepID=A0A1K2HSS0_9HYPH|nr:hypothetical protein [Devosia enhydra]SFZ80794.1 hypothetical protein SAMN02983003_0136 [Devosia enhydra]